MQKLNEILSIINLKLFDGEGSADMNDSADSNDAESIVQYGKQETADEPVENVDSEPKESEPKERNYEEEFENLIKGDYKKQYDDRVHKNISSKVAQINKLKAQNDSYSPLIQELSMKYGIKDGNVDSLLDAIRNDNTSYEKEAYEKI